MEKKIEEAAQAIEVFKKKELDTKMKFERSLLLDGINHEIGNPLVIAHRGIEDLGGLLGRMRVEHKETDPSSWKQARVYYDRAFSAIKRALEINMSLSVFSAQSTPSYEKLVLFEILTNAFQLAHLQVKEPCELKLLFSTNHTLYAMRREISQVFINIFRNSMQAMRGSEREKIIEVYYEEKENKAIIRVVDSGPGIPQEDLSKIGTAFYTTKDIGEGKGLGISLSRQLIEELHHGTLILQNAEQSNRGAEVILTLPLHLEEQKNVQSIPITEEQLS